MPCWRFQGGVPEAALACDSRCGIYRPTVQDLFLRSSCGRLPAVAGGPGSPELGRGVGAGAGGLPPWASEPLLTPRSHSFPRSSRPNPAAMKIAVIGQSLFGQEVYCHLREEGHEVVGVFTAPDKDGKADPLGEWWPGTTERGCPVGRGGSRACGVLCGAVGFPGQKRPPMVHPGSCSGASWPLGFSGTKWTAGWGLCPGEGPWRSLACSQGPSV